MRLKIRRPSGAWLIPRRTRWWAATWVMSAPSNQMEPSRGCIRPLIVFSVVVLPAPFAPISVTISPGWTSMSIPLSAWMFP